jgi:hypothetical protein
VTVNGYHVDALDPKEQQLDLELSALSLTFAAYYLNRATIEIKQPIPRWSDYMMRGFTIYKQLQQRDQQNERLSKERKARRRSQGEWL